MSYWMTRLGLEVSARNRAAADEVLRKARQAIPSAGGKWDTLEQQVEQAFR